MLYGLLIILFLIVAFFLGLLILIQQSKGNMGLGSLGGGAQMLFGGSGGQDIFQKATWVLGSLFMILSLFLALNKSRQVERSGYLRNDTEHSAPMPMPSGTEEY